MNSIPITYYLVLAGILFCGGLLIILIKKNAVFVLMGVELILNGAHLNLAAFSRFDDKMEGQILAVFSIVLTAAEVSIALAILLNIYKQQRTSDLDDLTDLKH
jgi:NADH:ubiquinone oxidoreductase subunit K